MLIIIKLSFEKKMKEREIENIKIQLKAIYEYFLKHGRMNFILYKKL